MSTRIPNQDRIAIMCTATTCLLVIALVTWANSPPATVPTNLEPDSNEALAMTVAAKGVQIYECRNGRGGTGYEWVFVAPEAELFDARDRRVGRHGAGPSWEASDGSKIVGTVRERAEAPVARAIPWLLLAARSVGPEGVLSRVTSVQRVNTLGGVAPTSGCNGDTIGTMARVAYTADYRFFAAR